MYTITQSRFFPWLLTALLAGSFLLSGCIPAATAAKIPTSPNHSATEDLPQISVSPTSLWETEIPPTTIPSKMSPSNTETEVTFGPLSLVVPPGVATGASVNEYPPNDSEEAAWWQKTPGHLQIMLGDYYILQGKFHQPQIYVYPAQAYAELVPPAFESLHRLNNILGLPNEPISADQLPAVPFFNAQQVFASNIQAISFQSGGGIRFLTEYAQSNAPVNNHELFYHFQGMTRDGAYYIIAILPITGPVLPETSDPAAALPSGGIALPDIASPQADWLGYYTAVGNLLNATPPDTFTPSINYLDLMIGSMRIAP